MKNFIMFCAIIGISLNTSCKKERLIANGEIKTETRTLATFNAIHTSGDMPVSIVYGTDFKVEVKGSANLLPYFETQVDHGKLYLNYKHVYINKSDISVIVTLPQLNSVSLSGSAMINIGGNFNPAASLVIDISGSGEINVNYAWPIEKLDINISGSGNIQTELLATKDAKVNISGSGNAKVNVTEKISATISGSGNIYYKGNPAQVNKQISGSGRLIQL